MESSKAVTVQSKAVTSPASSGVFEVEMGQKVGRFPIDRYKASKNKYDLITVIQKNPIVTKTHYHEDLGRFYYMDAAVELGLRVDVRYNFICIVWETDVKGKLIDSVNPKWALAYLSLGNDLYEDLVVKTEIQGDLAKLCMLVRCTDEQYQKLALEVVGESPHFRSKEMFVEIKDQYLKYKPMLPMIFASHITETRLREALGGGTADSEKADYAELVARQRREHTVQATDAVVVQEGSGPAKPSTDLGSADEFMTGFDQK